VGALKPYATGVLAAGLLLGQQLPLEPAKQFGSSITGAFEGWYDNADGSHSFLIGYLNRNRSQEIDVPIGPNNRIEPGGPDLGQPTHFLPGRQWGMFIVTVPKDFDAEQRLTWTITVNGQTTSIPLHLHPDYNISPFVEASNNTPPVLRFEEHGASIQGPIASLSAAIARTASVNAALPVTVWITDDMVYTSGTNMAIKKGQPPVTLVWSKYRGSGTVAFDNAKPAVKKLDAGEGGFSSEATTSVKFGEPGEYMLQITVNDYSGPGGAGFQCCWTTALVKVSVTP
jgi:hypothetical protein